MGQEQALALIAAATARSGLVWVRPDEGGPEIPVWHVWHHGAVYLVTGGQEQPLTGAHDGGRVLVVVRSRARQGDRLVQWWATVTQVGVGSDLWREVVPLLHAGRLNAVDGAGQPDRWARESVVLRLAPTGDVEPLGEHDHARPVRAG